MKSHRSLTPRQEALAERHLCTAVASLRGAEEVRAFFRDLCTPAELQAMADRWDMEEMRMFVVSLAIQTETGGNLAEILENLASVIRERASMMMKVRALSSEGRMTAMMLTSLPILTFILLFTMQPSFFLDVANDSMFVPGFVFLGFLYLTGVFVIRRMVNLKV